MSSTFRSFYLCFMLFFNWPIFKLEVTYFSEILIDFQRTMRAYISDDRIPNNHCCKNFIFYIDGICTNKAVEIRFSTCFFRVFLVDFGTYS
jgi:hypothetical protein